MLKIPEFFYFGYNLKFDIWFPFKSVFKTIDLFFKTFLGSVLAPATTPCSSVPFAALTRGTTSA